MDSQTLTIVLFGFNILIGLVIAIGGFTIQRYIKENDRKWDEQRDMNEKRADAINELNIKHEKNRSDIKEVEQRERLIEAQNAEKFLDLKSELGEIKKSIDELKSAIQKAVMQKP